MELFPKIAKMLGLSLVSKKFDKVWKIFKMSRILFWLFFPQYLQKLCKELIRQRENQNNNHKDILNNLIEVSKINPDMTEEILYKTFVQLFGDGYETAAAVNNILFKRDNMDEFHFKVFGFLMYQIVVNPDVQTQLQEEIDSIFDGKEDGEDLSADDLASMPYLDQVNNSCK